MRYEIKGPDGSGIIYIEDTKEYKIIVDAGDAIYVFDTFLETLVILIYL